MGFQRKYLKFLLLKKGCINIFKNSLFFVLLILTCFNLSGCSKEIDHHHNEEEKTVPLKKQTIDPIQNQIETMSLDEKIGQMVLVGFDGTMYNNHIKEMIEKYHIGGFILFQRNIQNSEQTLSLINAIKASNSKNNKLPLFISVDEEGGRVSRMPKEMKKLPTNEKIGEVNNKNFSFTIGKVIGLQLKSFGFNMNFAPVLDINSNPKNPIIGDRSFGSNEKIVHTLGIETIKGLQCQNIISVVKHFPGHGDTAIDSHLGLPTVDHDLDRLKSFELVPFVNAIKNNVNAIMVAHILFPKIDANNPATFSKRIITDILRNNLAFDGVIITDDMEMGAISKNYPIGQAAVKSIQAGSDIVLVCHAYENQLAVLNALKNAILNNEISEEIINDHVYRILKLKKKYNLTDASIQTINIEHINSEVYNTLNEYLN